MDRIETYLNKLDIDLNMNSEEIKEMKEEMRSHLLEIVKEAQQRGLSEVQAVSEALEHFGDEQLIRKDINYSFPKKRKSFLIIISLILLLCALVVQITTFSLFKFHQYERDSLLRSTENNLLSTPKVNQTQLEREISESISSGVIKDIIIQEHLSRNNLYTTIDSEGFGQDDSFWIETVVEDRIVDGGDKMYRIQYSYNIFINAVFVSLALFLSYWILFAYWFNRKFRDKKWTAIVALTNCLGYLSYKKSTFKSS